MSTTVLRSKQLETYRKESVRSTIKDDSLESTLMAVADTLANHMANQRTQKLKRYRSNMARILNNNKDADKVENRYRLIRSTLLAEFPNTVGDIEKETMLELLKDITFLDREVRLFTEGKEEELKTKLSNEKIVELKS